MHIFLHSQANFGRFFADQPTGQDSRPVFCGIGVQKRVIYVSPRWNDKMATFLTTALHRSRVESNFGAQSTCIMSLRSQFWTFFEPTDPDLMQKCRGNVLTLPLLCLDMHSMLFWPIGGPFSKKKMHEIHVLQNTEIRLENTRNTRTGCATRSSRPEISESVWYGGQQLSGPASTKSAIYAQIAKNRPKCAFLGPKMQILTPKFWDQNLKLYVPPRWYANMATFLCWQCCTGSS